MANQVGGTIVWNLDVNSSKFDAGLSKASAQAQAAGSTVSKSSNKMGSALAAVGKSSMLAATGILAGAAAIGFLGSKALKSTSDFQQSRIAFDTMLGSAEKGAKIMRELSKFAKTTPFNLPEVVQGAKGLLAYGIAADKIIPTFNALGNIAAGVGKDKLPQLTLAYGQVRTATKLTGNELRQFTEAGVPLLEALAKQSGKSAAQIKADMEDGAAPSFKEVEKALFSMTNKGGKFFNLMQKQSKTFQGRISNIMDSVGEVIRGVLGVDVEGNVAAGSIFDRVTKAAGALMNWLESNKGTIIAAIQGIFGFIEQNGKWIAIFIGTVLVAAFVSLGISILSATWPILLIAAGVTALVALFMRFRPQIMGVVNAVVGFYMSVARLLMPVLIAIWPVLQQIGSLVGGQLKKAWTDFSNAVRQFWIQIQPIVPYLKIAAAIIVGVFVVAIALAIGIIVAVVVVAARFIGIMARLFVAVYNAALGVTIWFGKIGVKAMEMYQSGARAVSSFIGMLGRFIGAVANAIGSAVRWFEGLKRGIVSALSGAGSWLVGAGSDLVRGFVNGIKSGIGSAIGAVKDMASSAVNAAKSALKIFSPSRVFADIGTNVGLGFVEGITATEGLVQNAMANMAAPNMTAGGAMNGGVSSSTTNTIGAVNVYREADENRLLGRLTRQDEVVSKGLTG